MFSCGLARTRAPRARLSAYRTRLPISLWPMRCRTNNKVKYTHTQYQHTALSTLAAHASQTVISLLEEHWLAIRGISVPIIEGYLVAADFLTCCFANRRSRTSHTDRRFRLLGPVG